ncbi:MAG: gliding motility-associated C-terminal domain-containing protein [Bacteroides sp.]|nr:gliding motility-associated C-terminal domain-containing protein [Ruminococcus flavefaciens]MCM1554970.1 gliding motility-associated C-terminal domain-containing protein [Bacteroides sp.]
MKSKIFGFVLAACLLLGFGFRLSAQTESVYRTWGKSIGKAQTDRDFLIYDATCSQTNPAIYIVGKAESGNNFELKRGENAYFHEKDEYTDAFLACYSLEGELQWSTYLPALDEGYYNAFASTVQYTSEGHIIVVGNTYQIQDQLSDTKRLIPNQPGKLFIFEFDTDGKFLRSQDLSSSFRLSRVGPLSIYYPPRIIKIKEQLASEGSSQYTLGGFILCDFDASKQLGYPAHIYSFDVGLNFNWTSNVAEYTFAFPANPATRYFATYALSVGWFNIIVYTQTSDHTSMVSLIDYTSQPENTGLYQTAKEETTIHTGSRGTNLLEMPPMVEQWKITDDEHHATFQYQGVPENTSIGSIFDASTLIHTFPGSVQNIHTYNGKVLVQGIHCKDYDNGFFKKDGKPYTYSHETEHLIPKQKGFYQNRNEHSTAVPYLLLYDSATVFEYQALEPIPPSENPDKAVFDFQPPLWGSYLNADWFYEDIFHVTDSGHKEDIYQPYEPILCSYGDKFFLIGNARNIGLDLIDNAAMTEEVNHHQGVILAFSMGCPTEKTAFQDVRFLCPDDSVELKVSPEYAGFKFRFKEEWLNNNSIVLNADNSRAWAKKEGLYHAVLDGSSIGCPDVQVDSVQISLSEYPEPVSGMRHDSITSCAATAIPMQATSTQHFTFSYLWYDGDTTGVKDVAFAGDSLFWATVDVNGYCTSFRDSTFVRFLPPYVNLGRDTALCYFRADTIADTAVLLKLYGRQGYFPGADWIFRWQINGKDAGTADSLLLRFSDLESTGDDRMQAAVSVFVSLSDTDTEGCTASDTLTVTLHSLPDFSPNRFLPQDSVLCAHLDLDLQLPAEVSDTYRCFWLDQDSVELPYGHDTSRFTITGMRGTDGFGAGTDTREPRFFQLKLEHKACGLDFFDTLLVYDQVKPALELPFHDTVICLNEPVELDSLSPFVYRPFYGFEWNTGEKHSEYSFSDSGTYVLTFSVLKDFAFCGYEPATDTVHALWSDPTLTLITLPEDTAFCERLSVTLDASVPFPSTRYSWQEGNLDDLYSPLDDSTLFTDPIIKVDREVTLALFVVDTMGCVNTLQVNVSEEDCTPQLSIPNVFTPNGDGVNDVLKFRQIEKCFDVDILIVDRKGSHVLHEKVRDADDFSWNGCYKNGSKKLPDGAYFYLVSYKDAYGKKKVQSGSITILGTAE